MEWTALGVLGWTGALVWSWSIFRGLAEYLSATTNWPTTPYTIRLARARGLFLIGLAFIAIVAIEICTHANAGITFVAPTLVLGATMMGTDYLKLNVSSMVTGTLSFFGIFVLAIGLASLVLFLTSLVRVG